MQQVAMSWLVYRLTGSPFLLGVVIFCNQFPTFLFSSFAGVLADRWDRRRILLLTQTLSLLQALLLALLTMRGVVAVWHIIALGVFLGLVNSVDIPARQSFLIDMIDNKKDLGNAIALNSSLVNLARLIGPSLAGILIALVGEGVCFLINALSFLAVIGSLVAMRIAVMNEEGPSGDLWSGWKEGLRYAFGFSPIGAILILLGLLSMSGTPYMVLMPIFATRTFHGGPHTLGFLMAASGMGALIGAIYLASRKNILGLWRIIAGSALFFGLSIMGFSFSRVLWLSLFLNFTGGFAMMVGMAASNTILQTIVDDDKRGRVMSLFATAFIGTAPIGSLIAGALAERIGAPLTVLLGGSLCLLGGIGFLTRLASIRRAVRPVYLKMGIVPGS